jgi:hypothetical protein
MTATTNARLTDAVEHLVDEADFYVHGAVRAELSDALQSAVDQSVVTCNAAFDLELPDALDEAHRTLFSLYADRIWKAPKQPRPDYARIALEQIRANLEQGFRHYLGKRRMGVDGLEPPPGGGRSEWLAELALGAHPHEDSGWPQFIREQATLDQLREIVAQRSLFFLREPDPWIYALPTLSGQAKAGLIDLLLDEYGWGKLERMHSSVYSQLMEALGLDSHIDHYSATTSWQYLATLNHQWMLALTTEYSRRLLGTIYLTEADSPNAMTNYLAAWKRLGIEDPRILEFYEIHVQADENHRDVALHEVIEPVCALEDDAEREVAIGIFDGRTVEAEFARHLKQVFSRGETSLSD